LRLKGEGSTHRKTDSSAFLEEVVVNDTQFYGSKWIGAFLRTVQFSDSDFRTANFSFADFVGKNNMTRNVLTNTRWDDVRGKSMIDFRGSKNCPEAVFARCKY
jgi:uncharacterized protein YjbI with pentapeptide repeats